MLSSLVNVLVRGRNLSEYDLFESITLLPIELGQARILLLPVSWTLSFEIIFYGVFSLLMLLPRNLALVFILVWGTAAVSLGEGPLLSPFIAQFAAGCLLGYAVPRINPERLSLTALVVCAILLLIGGAHSEGTLSRVIWFGSFGVTAVLLAVCLEARDLVAGKGLVTMGGASYALYVFHFPILQAFGPRWATLKLYPDIIWVVVPLSLAASWLWWVHVEKNANRWMKAKISVRFQRQPTDVNTVMNRPGGL